ncbi:hypothetical protein BGX38DRAFT_1139771 [Terfezia claveryi]|nr:hypothetical protein BGX38DRAFT_1139771 [Terfezia claveryi]
MRTELADRFLLHFIGDIHPPLHTTGYELDKVGMELEGENRKKAEPIFVELVSMAGWKLGGWLNLLATQKLGLDLGPVKEELVAVEEEVGEDDHYRGAYTMVPRHDEL